MLQRSAEEPQAGGKAIALKISRPGSRSARTAGQVGAAGRSSFRSAIDVWMAYGMSAPEEGRDRIGDAREDEDRDLVEGDDRIGPLREQLHSCREIADRHRREDSEQNDQQRCRDPLRRNSEPSPIAITTITAALIARQMKPH